MPGYFSYYTVVPRSQIFEGSSFCSADYSDHHHPSQNAAIYLLLLFFFTVEQVSASNQLLHSI